jgi:glycosyltransferase involved in cell wall biosynthesis
MTSRRVRLLQLVHGYPPALGGVELSIRDLCERLVRDYDFDVTVFTTDAYTVSNFADASLPTIPITRDEEQNGVRIRRFPVRSRVGSMLDPVQRVAYRLRLPGNDVLRTLANGPIVPEMLEAMRGFPADVICSASFPLNHMRYPFMLRQPRPPVVLIGAVHTNDDWGFNRANLLRLVGRSYATVAHTEHEREWLIGRGADPDRLRVIPHGLDPDELRPEPGAFRAAHGIDPSGYLVAYVGQHASHKGLDVLVDAFELLIERVPDAWLAIGGAETPYSRVLAGRIAQLPAETRSRVRLMTNLSEAEKANIFGDCDVFTSPSQAESFGITTLEAWSQAKPVVVGDSPSQPWIVDDGRTGYIVPYGQSEPLFAALLRLADERLRTAIGRAGYDQLRSRFSRAVVDDEYATLLAEAAAVAQQGGKSSGGALRS